MKSSPRTCSQIGVAAGPFDSAQDTLASVLSLRDVANNWNN